MSGGLCPVSGTNACGIFKNLHRSRILIQGDHLSHQFLRSHIDHLGHFKANVSLHVDDRSVDSVYTACLRHFSHLPGTENPRILSQVPG